MPSFRQLIPALVGAAALSTVLTAVAGTSVYACQAANGSRAYSQLPCSALEKQLSLQSFWAPETSTGVGKQARSSALPTDGGQGVPPAGSDIPAKKATPS